MKTEITRDTITAQLENASITDISIAELFSLFEKEEGLRDFAPDGVSREDPRDGHMIVFNSKRAKRPHDNREGEKPKTCPVCAGKTTGIVDLAPLSEGYTFINKNLFPCFYLRSDAGEGAELSLSRPLDGNREKASYGLHFLQWTSSKHGEDWHNMSLDDLVRVIQRLAALEKKLLFESAGHMPPTGPWHDGKQTYGFVTAIQNLGVAVGCSLAHGHQQIAFSNTMSTQTYNNWRFFRDRKQRFSEHLLAATPKALVVRDYGRAEWIVPFFMKRPYYTMLALRDFTKQFLFEMDAGEVAAVAWGWADAARVMKGLLEEMGRAFAYNVVVHNGPGAGLYLEFLPFSQETGGFELAGIWVCQSKPEAAADALRENL